MIDVFVIGPGGCPNGMVAIAAAQTAKRVVRCQAITANVQRKVTVNDPIAI